MSTVFIVIFGVVQACIVFWAITSEEEGFSMVEYPSQRAR